MKISDLKRLKKEAPPIGQALIYTMDKVYYEPYSDVSEIIRIIKGEDKDILEMHLFDDEKEYRCIATESKRFPGGIIEAVIGTEGFEGKDENDTSDFSAESRTDNQEKEKNEEGNDSYFSETCLLEEGSKLTVLNHISYNENGMAEIDGYRLLRKEA